MDFNPFTTAGDYPKMLNKIATFTFFGALLSIWLLRYEIPYLDNILKPFSVSIPIGGVSISFGTLLPAFVIATISRFLKLHDRISDLFGIRRRFDVSEILLPMATASGAAIDTDQIRTAKTSRKSLMYRVFYKYASGTKGKAAIDSHYIIMALDQWSWYWILLELTFLALLVAATLGATAHYQLAMWFLIGVMLALALLQAIRKFCSDYALQEVEAILENPARRLEIAEVFRAL